MAAVLSIALVVIWIVGSFDYGVISGLEVVSAAVVALVAVTNWYAVRLVVGKAVR